MPMPTRVLTIARAGRGAMSPGRPSVSTVKIEFEGTQASTVVDILMHLAALIDPEDPDGLRDAFGQRDARLKAHALTDAQFMMLRHPAYRADERDEIVNSFAERDRELIVPWGVAAGAQFS